MTKESMEASTSAGVWAREVPEDETLRPVRGVLALGLGVGDLILCINRSTSRPVGVAADSSWAGPGWFTVASRRTSGAGTRVVPVLRAAPAVRQPRTSQWCRYISVLIQHVTTDLLYFSKPVVSPTGHVLHDPFFPVHVEPHPSPLFPSDSYDRVAG
jgi:hypothetical protein